MKIINSSVKWIMLVSGLLTTTMLYGLFAPQEALESMFGASFDGELESLIVRSWSALVGLMGIVLIVGFFEATCRRFSLLIAAASKLVFVVLVLIYGETFLSKLAAAIVMDTAVVIVAVVFLISSVRHAKRLN